MAEGMGEEYVMVRREVLNEEKLECVSERQDPSLQRPPIAERLKRCTR